MGGGSLRSPVTMSNLDCTKDSQMMDLIKTGQLGPSGPVAWA